MTIASEYEISAEDGTLLAEKKPFWGALVFG